jgi:hypothetical protein
MLLEEKKKTANTLHNIATYVLKNKIIPVETTNGTIVGNYIIQFKNNEYIIKSGNFVHYKTFSKSSAIAICYILSKTNDKYKILSIVKADHDMFFSQNDLQFIQHAYKVAKKKNDIVKCEILENKYSFTYEKYERSNSTLKNYLSTII